MSMIVLSNAMLLDPAAGEYREGCSVLVEGEMIKEVSDGPISAAGARVIDIGGRVLMPGLIDAHVHVTACTTNLRSLALLSPSFVTAVAKTTLGRMLARGFTTVRDCGGADWGLAEAVRQGHFRGPRLFISGQALAQTGGQGDFRLREEEALLGCPFCRGQRTMSRVVDGVDAIRLATRQELRRGADQIKLMAGGGMAGGIPIERSHFSVEEMATAVEEARAAGTYVMAHAYAPESIRRAVDAGVRTIEHGNLVDADTARRMAEAGTFMVPTLSVYEGYFKHAAEIGVAPAAVAGIPTVLRQGQQALDICRAAGVKMGFGTDLEGILEPYQTREFALRAEVLPPIEVLRSATTVNAEILQMSGKLGTVAPGAYADLIVVDGNPLETLAPLLEPERGIVAVMKGGVLHKNSIDG